MHKLFRAGDRVQRKPEYASRIFGPDNTEQFEIGVVQPDPGFLQGTETQVYVRWQDGDRGVPMLTSHLNGDNLQLIERADRGIALGDSQTMVTIAEVGSDMSDLNPVVWEDVADVANPEDWVRDHSADCVGAQVEPGYTQDFVATFRRGYEDCGGDLLAVVAFTVFAPHPTPVVTVV